MNTVTESKAVFFVSAAEKECKTWYKIVGDLTSSSRRPLIVLHGGPGSTHDYMLPLTALSQSHSVPVILYDQLGNGKSTHLPEKAGDVSFWTVQLFLDELDNLLAHLGIGEDYDLLGQSWGGMLAACHAARQPSGLKHLILVSAPADMPLWVEAQNLLRKKLPEAVQAALIKHEAAGTFDDKEYTDAVQVFYERHLCLVKPMPAELMESFAWMEKDPTVYHTMNGPSEFFVIGSLKTWSVIDDAHKIDVPTLITNGRYDEAQDSTIAAFFSAIRKVKWVQFAESSHTSHLEESERFIEVVGGFLTLS